MVAHYLERLSLSMTSRFAVLAMALCTSGDAEPVKPVSEAALPHDLIMPQLKNLSYQESDSNFMADISKRTCWVGEFTEESCCKKTDPACWDEHLTMGECCPNADCWEGSFNYDFCCAGDAGIGNQDCWGDVYTYARCCALSEPSTTWVDNLFNAQSTSDFYSFDEFYNDAQYGHDFGYYSTGLVIGAGKAAPDANEFAHFTTFPMALSPHFGRVMMRSIYLMWRERDSANMKAGLPADDIFQVVEMGAGSGQLGQDIRNCVLENCLHLPAATHKRWLQSFRYTILERSPALAARQRERGLEVIVSDAQTVESCGRLKAQAARENFIADVVISNELVDAFAPVKLKLSVFDLDNIDAGMCSSWTEMKLLHLVKIQDVMGLFATTLGIRQPEVLVKQLQDFTTEFFCNAAGTSVGQVAMALLPKNTSCLTMVLGLSDLMEMTKFQIPAASNNVRLRLRKDHLVQANYRRRVLDLEKELKGFLAIPRHMYQELRKALKRTDKKEMDITFMIATKTKRLSVPITPERCKDNGIGPFLRRHAVRARRLARFYHDLGYPSMYVLMRPGEEEFLKLTDCLLNKEKSGYVLTIDYGASYEPLSHSLSVDPQYDGIFVPPIPHHLMSELPHCHGDWTVCAGHIDWTTFVDFTNMAAVGNELGYETIFYGPQSFLEQIGSALSSTANVEGDYGVASGYSILENVEWIGRHTINWYGPEKSEPHEQRWTGFKALLQRVPPVQDRSTGLRIRSTEDPLRPLTKAIEPIEFERYGVVKAPSWHLDSAESDPCWLFDPSEMPIADWVKINVEASNTSRRQVLGALSEDVNHALGTRYGMGYEDAQLSFHLVGFLVKAVGCLALSKPETTASQWSAWYKARWTSVWKEEALDKVGPAVMKALRDEAVAKSKNTTLSSRAYPYECIARQTFRILCG